MEYVRTYHSLVCGSLCVGIGISYRQSKYCISDHGNDFSDGVTLTNNVINVVEPDPIVNEETGELSYSSPTFNVTNKSLTMTYLDVRGETQEYEFFGDSAKNNAKDGVVSLTSVTSSKNFIGFLHLDNRTLPDGKSRYHITY